MNIIERLPHDIYTVQMGIREKISSAPDSPGVYIMKGADGGILYVGKAKVLKNRIRSYFGKSRDSRYQIRFLLSRVADIDFIVTDTEKEALILENTLIKKHRPRYNLNLRDDKTYFSLRMEMDEEFPRLTVVRKVPRDGARYFGPYSSAFAAKEVLKHLYKLFPLRHYPLETCRRRGRPCLFYQIKQCSAPCHGLISREEYMALAEGASLFLNGKNTDLLKVLKIRMTASAAAEKYEEAARCRDLIRSIELTVEKQKMVTGGGDMDVVGFHRNGERMEYSILFIRGGAVTGSRNYALSWELDDIEGVASFITEYYCGDAPAPEEILLPVPIHETEGLAELLSEKRGGRVRLAFPKRGLKAELVKLANRNAESAATEKKNEMEGEALLSQLKEQLRLPAIPRRIECYDISNIQGQNAVGSRVAFLDGKPDKANYRRYRIRGVDQADDFAMMQEVLSRRFKQDGSGGEPPDLIVVDGGIGQLNVLIRVLSGLGMEGVAAAGLAKSRVEKGMEKAEVKRSSERVFLPGRKNPVVLRQNSAPLLLLARIRDEAHRFAVTYHKKVRGKETIKSALQDIPGVGEKRVKALLQHFGSLKNVSKATTSELLEVKGMSRRAAEALWLHFHNKKEGAE